MAMAVDSRHQLPMSGIPYDNLRYSAAPEFTNPWATANQPSQMYPQQQLPPVTSGFDEKVHRPNQLPPSYPLVPTSGAQMSSGFLGQSRSYPQEYSIPATTQPSSFIPTSSAAFAPSYPQPILHDYNHELPRPAYSHRAPQQGREAFSDAIDASRNIVALSQTDLTPKPIYGNDSARHNGPDAYGFPGSNHSPHSSISSASSYPYQYGSSVNSSISGSIAGSVDGSVTDYSSAGEDAIGPRTLPRPVGYMGAGMPPAASSMMSQFNSKVSPSTQKKHKCKICDKRFTRPSSLQTHMYSHTGEKPFACDVEGCGRHFSVVSNLRRHKKVHRGEVDRASPDED